MRVSKSQIVHGVADYIKEEILPKMADGRAVQIIVSIGINSMAANDRLVDSVFDNEMVKAMLNDDGSGTYEIDGLMAAIKQSIEQYGAFPVKVPAIPLLSPSEITLKLDAADVEAMRRRIEGM